MFARNIYRDEAVLSLAQPEPLDTLARFDVPHQYLAKRILGILSLITLTWLAMGSTEHSLWLEGVTSSPPEAEDPESSLRSPATVSSLVSQTTADRLSVGMEVDVLLAPGSNPASLQGRLVSVEKRADQVHTELGADTRGEREEPYRLVFAVPVSEAAQLGRNPHRLRLVIGQQRLIEFVASLVVAKPNE